MGIGTDVAIQSASITLIRSDLKGILRARNNHCGSFFWQ